MKQGVKAKGGFTLVELMVSMIAFAILSLAVGSMLVNGWLGWKRNNDLVDMQRNASLAMIMMTKEIRNARYADITAGTGSVSIIRSDGSNVLFNENNETIVRSPDGMVIIDEGLVPGSFSVAKRMSTWTSAATTNSFTNAWIDVGFDLKTTTEEERYSTRVTPRNE